MGSMDSVSPDSNLHLLTSSFFKSESDDEVVNETDSSSSASSFVEVVRVESSTVIVYFLIFVLLLSLGVVANVVVVVAARWPIRSHHFWRRLAIANLCVVQLFVCVLVTPLGMTSALLSFLHRPLQAELCSASFFLLRGGLAATVAGLVLVAGVRWRELELVCSGESQEATGNPAMTACLALGPWIFGSALAALALLDFPGSVGFIVCRDAELRQTLPVTSATWRIKPSIAVVYAVLATLAVIKLAIAYRYHSNRLERLLASWRERSEQTTLLGKNQTNRNQNKKKKPKPGQTVKLSPLDADGRRPSKLTVDGQDNVLCQGQEDVDGVEDGGTEDTFDMKMRLKFKKKPRSSERRHTVANIGLPDLSSQRRRSLENGKVKASSPANEYQYVRKWSVDITALANQLENPKLHTSSYPTLRNTSPGSGSTCGDPGEELERAGNAEAGATSAKGSSVLLLPGITKGTIVPPGRSSDGKGAYANLETPSIVVSLTPDTEADTLDDSFETRSGLDSEISGENRRPSLPLETAGRSPDDKGVIAAREELSEVLRTTVVMLVSLVLVLPMTVSDLLETPIRDAFGTNVDHNLDLMMGALCLVQGLTIPLLLIWSSRDIREQLMVIMSLLKNLRCVCYCNLGAGRSREKRQPKV